MRTSAAAVAKRLKAEGFKPYGVKEMDDWENEDGNVSLSETVHVQVGHNYVNVVHINKQGLFKFYPEAKTYEDLVSDIHKAMKEPK